MLTKRLEKIFSYIPTCSVFADVGCDHGLIAKQVIETTKAKKVIISDVSKKCLEKAENLLSEEIANGKALAVVSDGFDNLPPCDCALIAGMGGEEIICILLKAKSLPENLILQPMKNTNKVRKTLIELGYQVNTDLVFKDGKIFYDLIVCKKGNDFLTDEEIEFGRTNLIERSKDFIASIECKINALKTVCVKKDLNQETKISLEKEIERLSEYVKIR